MARKLLITGGAGFIGANAAEYFAGLDWQVVIYDNLSRRGTENNLSWLQSVASVEFVKGDTRDRQAVEQTFEAHAMDSRGGRPNPSYQEGKSRQSTLL